MLFTTATFALLFLPLTVLLFFLIGRHRHHAGAFWLFAASLFFYGYWMPRYTLLLVASIVVNFEIGKRIASARERNGTRRVARAWMIAGITFDLALLGYFKYTNFLVDTIEALLGTELQVGRVLLPIGISFFTFTQIAFLADAYQKGVREYKFVHYGLFVTYFPHLVAGPVLHHAQMMPQFGEEQTYRFQFANLAGGLGIFCLGLLKKIVIADGMSPYADAVFDGVSQGGAATCVEAWLGALAYTFQLYFDFSGYSDMAIGLSWMVNVRLPFNFDSPYKSHNISEFWRRWHMSLSAFLRDYLYIPLGGNRRGRLRRYVNLFVTMFLGGLWHGASWTFAFWGALHGVYLAINHAFHALTAPFAARLESSRPFRGASWLLTFLAVIVGWVFFRAPTFGTAAHLLQAMASTPLRSTPPEANGLLWNAGLHALTGLAACALLTLVIAFAPNSNLIGERLLALCRRDPRARAIAFGFAATIAVFLVVLNESRDSVSAFIYFNF